MHIWLISLFAPFCCKQSLTVDQGFIGSLMELCMCGWCQTATIFNFVPFPVILGAVASSAGTWILSGGPEGSWGMKLWTVLAFSGPPHLKFWESPSVSGQHSITCLVGSGKPLSGDLWERGQSDWKRSAALGLLCPPSPFAYMWIKQGGPPVTG